MIVLNHPQGSDDWLRARLGVCTASRFSDARGKLAKASKNGQAGDHNGDAIKYAWLLAVETIAGEPLDETFVTYAMRRGRELEPQARAVYEARTGAWIDEVSLILTDDSRFGYSADGFRDDDGLIEIKCPMAADKLGAVWSSPETAHLEYIDQINGGLWITGRKWWTSNAGHPECRIAIVMGQTNPEAPRHQRQYPSANTMIAMGTTMAAPMRTVRL